MRNIRFQTPHGDMDLQVSDEFVRKIATKNGLPESAVSDTMIVRFFRDASDVAFARAAAEYLASDGKDS